MDKHIRQFSAETKALEDSRSLIVTISTPTPDRSGDVVVPKGAKLDHFLKNPVVLFGHKYNEPPIARADELVVTDDGIKAKVTFPPEGTYQFADAIYGLIKAGIMHAWSIGFQSDRDQTEPLPGGGVKFNEWELLEFSAVPVPANPEALTILRSKGLEEAQIKELTEEPVETSKVEKTELVTVTFGKELDEVAFTLSDGQTLQCSITPELKELLLPADPQPEHPDPAVALKALRDALKSSDKEIGLVLRTLNTLLEKPKSEGGEN